VVVDSTSRAARRRAARAERIERKAAASNARRAAKAAAKAAKDAKKAAKDDAKRAAKQAVKKTAKTPVTPSTGAASTSLAQDGALGVSVPPAGDGWPVAPATTVTAPTPFEVPASKQPKQSKAKRTKSKPAKTKTVKTKPAKAKTGKAKPARTAPRPMPAATPAPGGSPAVRDGADLWASALPPAPAHDALPEQLPQDDPWAAAASATTSRTTPPASHLGAASNPPGAASPAPIDRQPATGALADDAAWVSSVGSVPARPAEAPAPRGSRQAPGKRPEADVDPGVFGIPEGLPDRQDRVIEDAPRDAS
jgi:hypothetical protein